MKKALIAASLTILITVFCQAVQARQPMEIDAEAAAMNWLALVDKGKYSESWRTAAAYLKNAVTKENWAKSMESSRQPIGKVKSRKCLSRKFTRTLPGAPDGEYVVIRFASSFEKKESAVETVTPMLDKDGVWRVAGYYIE